MSAEATGRLAELLAMPPDVLVLGAPFGIAHAGGRTFLCWTLP
jgi:hypothetical protein